MKRKKTNDAEPDAFERNRRTYEGIAEFIAFMDSAGALLGRGPDWIAFDVEAARRAFGNEDPWDFLIASRLRTNPNLDVWGVTSIFTSSLSNGEQAFVHLTVMDEPAEYYPYIAEIKIVLDSVPHPCGEQLEKLSQARDELVQDLQAVFAENQEQILDALFNGDGIKQSGPTKH